jgi:hypothetical protein
MAILALRRHDMKCILSIQWLTTACTFWGCTAAMAQVAKTNDKFSYNLGAWWYIRGVAAHDGGTLVDGGAEGSSLLYRTITPGGVPHTEWVLLEGHRIWIAPPNTAHTWYRVAPGRHLLTKHRQLTSDLLLPSEVGHAAVLPVINSKLIEFYQATQHDPHMAPIRTVPFLANFCSNGACDHSLTYRDAEDVATMLHFTLVTSNGQPLPPDTPLLEQDPPGGVYWPEDHDPKIYVWSRFQSMMTSNGATRPQLLDAGDTTTNAIAIDPAKPEVEVTMTYKHKDDRIPPTCYVGNASAKTRDVFLKWGPGDEADVTVEILSSDPPTPILSAITATGAEIACRDPALSSMTFHSAKGEFYFVVVEFADVLTADVRLRFTAAGGPPFKK